jgi:hypothetical protein
MGIQALIRLALGAMVVILAGCSSPCREQVDLAGNSVGCGNPPVTTSWDPSVVNECGSLEECGLGTPLVTSFVIGMGEALSLEFRFPIKYDSPKVRLYVYESSQAPFLRKAPLDSFEMEQANGFLLKAEDLETSFEKSIQYASAAKSFTFNLHIKLVQEINSVAFQHEAILAVLSLDLESKRFSSSKFPSWSFAQGMFLREADRYFQGGIAAGSADPKLAEAASAYVFIPGSPYFAKLEPGSDRFVLGPVPVGGYELRLIVISNSLPANRKLPVFTIVSRSDSTSARTFKAEINADSVIIPEDFP